MAILNASSYTIGVEITPSIGALPYVEVDQASVQVTQYSIQALATVFVEGEGYRVQLIYNGDFDFSTEQSLYNSVITGGNLASQTVGSFSYQGISLTFRDFLGDPSAAAAKMLQDSDTIIGTTQADVLDGYFGDDVIRGRKGDDAIWGGAGNDRLFGNGGRNTLNGGPGSDSFYVKVNPGRSVNIVEDFSLTDDVLYIRGDIGNVSYVALDGSLALYQTNADNPFAILSGISESQLLLVTIEGW